MKLTWVKLLLLGLLASGLFAVTLDSSAQSGQNIRFFRITGPAATKITAIRADGSLVWSNALSGTNYTVQTTVSFAGISNWVDYVQISVTNSFSTNQIVAFNPPANMVFIPAGWFTMGDTLDGLSDAAPTNIYVSAFYLDTYLVTYSQWLTVYSYATNHGYGFFQGDFTNAAAGQAANHPVQRVDWYDCVKWSNARSVQAGLTPVYYADAAFTQVFTNGDKPLTVYANWSAKGYRLPTEAEWEKAARGGLSGQRFPWGNTISESQANYYAKPASYPAYDLGPYTGYNKNFSSGAAYTSPVGYFAPNGYGLYDMAGNVFEWCWDWYATPYGQPSNSNPRGPSGSSGYHVLRGGAWNGYAYYERCAYRYHNTPGYSDTDFGFRCARGL